MQSIDIKDIFKKSWLIYKEHLWAISFVYFAVFLILAFVRQISSAVFVFPQEYLWLFKIMSFLVQAFVSMGVLYMVLKIDKHRAPELNDFFTKLNRFFSFVLLLLIISTLFYLGLYFLIVPAFFVLLIFSFAPYAFLDKNLGPFQSLYYSFQIGKGHWYKLTIFWIIIMFINIVSSFLLLPMIVAVPFSSIAVARLYIGLACLQEQKEECKLNLSTTENYHKAIAFVFIFVLAFYGTSLYFKKPWHNKVKTINKSDQGVASQIPDKIKSTYEDVKLAIEFYKEENAKCPTKVEIEEILQELPDWSLFDYKLEDSTSFCKLCLPEYNLCEKL